MNSWVTAAVVGIGIVVAAYVTQDLWAKPVNGALAKAPVLPSIRNTVANLGSKQGY